MLKINRIVSSAGVGTSYYFWC